MTHCNRQLYTYTTIWYDMIGMFQSEVIAQLLSQRSSSANTMSRCPRDLDPSSVFCSSNSLIDFHLDQVKAKEAAKPAEGNAVKPWFLVIFWLRGTFVWNWTLSRTVPMRGWTSWEKTCGRPCSESSRWSLEVWWNNFATQQCDKRCKMWTHFMRYSSISHYESHSWYFAHVGFVVMMRLLRVVSWLVRQSPYSHQSSATMMISKVKKMPFIFPRLMRGNPIDVVNPIKPTRLSAPSAPVHEVVPSLFEQFPLDLDQPLRLSSAFLREFSKSEFWVWMKLSTNTAVQILDKVAMQWMIAIKVSSKSV